MTDKPKLTQRDVMRRLYKIHGGNKTFTVAAYAKAEREGQARRTKNSSKLDPESYAEALYRDGLRRGWLI